MLLAAGSSCEKPFLVRDVSPTALVVLVVILQFCSKLSATKEVIIRGERGSCLGFLRK